ncbi:conserved domain protein [Treponema primitia ZAS-2]|uniref:Conserved domain protein n=1 Tax=Treponema primitia (strain ATCC BAA-887 / DSM 12427 / ZAS-2) TaxID=545694 RepID=F5YI84_TREPZ|nr:helix-turn-helix domain-containing protein [Treponema primitia]AEF84432.1 conserved domain protein [Treponema primitia ZAS-2]
MDTTLTITDVAEKLQLSLSTVYKFAEEGTLPALKVGKQWRFTEEDIKQYLQSCKMTNVIKEE